MAYKTLHIFYRKIS